MLHLFIFGVLLVSSGLSSFEFLRIMRVSYMPLKVKLLNLIGLVFVVSVLYGIGCSLCLSLAKDLQPVAFPMFNLVMVVALAVGIFAHNGYDVVN